MAHIIGDQRQQFMQAAQPGESKLQAVMKMLPQFKIAAVQASDVLFVQAFEEAAAQIVLMHGQMVQQGKVLAHAGKALEQAQARIRELEKSLVYYQDKESSNGAETGLKGQT